MSEKKIRHRVLRVSDSALPAEAAENQWMSFLNLPDRSSANPIFTRSGTMKGITHQASAVASAISPVLRAYTNMNHAVPNA